MTRFGILDVFDALRHLDLDQTNEGSDPEGYGTCLYNAEHDEMKPGCIVGQVIFVLDPEMFYSFVRSASLSWSAMPAFIRTNFTDEANQLFVGVQAKADRAYSWRESLNAAGVEISSTVTNTFELA